ncbi:hypothetical protein J2J97_32450 (plasmid) [Rhizobium bangladeshense]|uniref:hypothetical protein n=1 Tax=Rhizobium bangladeshense TaxID=1138189 RepID=UPI001A9819C9|nr:hypothetical protein [Rhizobium bangladeshense]QSY98617.1 hypothetical protein J2J97_32450 [Rhizobium bangladeshense]
MARELVDITVVQHHSTGSAILVSETGNRDKAVWLPGSAVEVSDTGKKQRETITGPSRYSPRMCPIVEVTLPVRLAEDKGLV